MCPSLEVFTVKGARNFGEIVRQLWGGKKRRRNSTIVFYDEYTFYTIVGFSISIKWCYTVAFVYLDVTFLVIRSFMQARLILANWSCDARNLVIRGQKFGLAGPEM